MISFVRQNSLQKQLSGGAPSIRTVAFAYELYGVSVKYEGIAVTRAITRIGCKSLWEG